MQADFRDVDAVDHNLSASGIDLHNMISSTELIVHGMHMVRTKRRILMASVDLPLPVLPKSPTRSFAFKEKETP